MTAEKHTQEVYTLEDNGLTFSITNALEGLRLRVEVRDANGFLSDTATVMLNYPEDLNTFASFCNYVKGVL